MDIELSIVMPCLNEAETLEKCIRKATRFLDRTKIRGEIIIGDNGSTDGSQDIARSLGAHVVDIPIRGYGAALYGAICSARGKYCIMGDSDDSYDFSRLEPFVAALKSGCDLVMGNRFAGGIAPGAMPWKNRYIGNPILSGIGRFLFRCPAKDFHCGLRGFSVEAFRRMDLRTTGMEFASEMVIKATLLKMRISEVPTTLSPDGRSRAPHLRPYHDAWRHFRFMMLFSPNWLFVYPGQALFILGLIFGGLLFFRPLQIGDIRFSIDTMIYCSLAIEVGFQAMLFAVLSRTYAAAEGLFPSTRPIQWVAKFLTFECGLVLSAFMLLIGCGLFFHALSIWSNAQFGALNADDFSRIVIVSSLMLALGMELLFSTFLFSILKLNIRVMPPEFMEMLKSKDQ